MANKVVYVKAIGQDGKVLVDKPINTMANGFFELWLPRNEKIAVTVRGYGKSASGVVATFPRSKTCLTNFHLL